MRDTRRRLRESGGIDLDVQYVQIRRIYSGRLGGGGGWWGCGVIQLQEVSLKKSQLDPGPPPERDETSGRDVGSVGPFGGRA